MKITVEVDGVVFIVEGDDDDRVIAAAMKVGRHEKLTPSDGVVMSNSPDANPWLNFIERIGDKPDQLRVLRLVKQQGPNASSLISSSSRARWSLVVCSAQSAAQRCVQASRPRTRCSRRRAASTWLAQHSLRTNFRPSSPRTTRYDRINEAEEDDA